jgi:hypothetical protein
VARGLLAEVAGALDAAHDAGSVHGAVCAHNVLVDRDGRALLTDFGLGDEDVSQRADREAFAALAHAYGGIPIPDPVPGSCSEIVARAPRERRGRRALVGAGVPAAAAIVVVLATRGSDEQPRVPVPLPGATVLGSALPAAGVTSVSCTGKAPSENSAPCTIAQTRLAGAATTAARGGVIRRWTVRGARGAMALEVLRPRGLSYFMVARTPFVRIPDTGVHVLPANLPARAGELVALDMTPGSSIGTRVAPGATTARWLGPLEWSVRPPDASTGLDRELMLRTEYVAGARYRPAGRLTGAAAARAPAGRELGRFEVRPGFSVVAVQVGGRTFIDAYARGRRVERLPVAGADPAGRLISLEIGSVRFGVPIVWLQWRNPTEVVSHMWTTGRRLLTPLG